MLAKGVQLGSAGGQDQPSWYACCTFRLCGNLPILAQAAAATTAAAAAAATSLAAGLAQNKYLEDKAFLNYLQYLEYWRQPQYATYIRCEMRGTQVAPH
jgi:hypothetical protein